MKYALIAFPAWLLLGAPPARGEPAAMESLFNGRDLAGWSALIEKVAPGEFPPGLVTVRDGAIHMYADVPADEVVGFGTIYHERTFSRFHLAFEYAWGKKQFAPRATGLRDAGLLYHIARPAKSEFGVWPASLECQIQEGDTGDIMLVKSGALTWLNPEPDAAPEGQGIPGRLPEDGGLPALLGEGKYIGRYPVSDRTDGWNQVDVIVRGDESAVHMINGVVRARLALSEDAKGAPLAAGKIGLQLEGAEILYRNIRIRELPAALEVPAPYAVMSTVKGVSTGEMEIRVTNRGKVPIPLELGFSGKDAASFRIERGDPNLPPMKVLKEGVRSSWVAGNDPELLKAGAEILYRVRFLPTGAAGRYSAGLQIGPLDEGVFVILQGLASDALEGENEPPLERIVHSLGIPLNVGGPALKLGTDAAVIGSSQPAATFRRAGDGPVKLTPLARYSPPGAYPFGWQGAGDGAQENVAGVLADSTQVPDAHQRLLPPLAGGGKSVEFSPGDEPFGLFIRAGKGVVGTNPAKHPSRLAHPVRIFPVAAVLGKRVSNALLVCFEEASNGDYQDSVFLMENAVIDGTR